MTERNQMLNYLKYMITVPRKFILNWAISGGVYLLILPLAFANSSVESLLIDTQREAFRGMSENETVMNLLGIQAVSYTHLTLPTIYSV